MLIVTVKFKRLKEILQTTLIPNEVRLDVELNREWKWVIYQRDNNPTKEQNTADGHKWVFNTAKKSRNKKRASAGPAKKCVLVQ